jgi:hypothetical protein
MAALPFNLDVLLPHGGEPTELELVIEAEADAVPSDDEPLLLSCDEVVRLFLLTAGGDQFFSPGPRMPGRASVSLLGDQMSTGGTRYRYHLRVHALPVEAFGVLVAMLVQNAYAGDPIERVSLRALQPVLRPLNTAAFLGMQRTVTARREPLPFNLDYPESVHGSRQRTVALEFLSPLTREMADDIGERFNRWDHLMVLGGFRLDFEEVDGLPSFGDTAHLSPRLLEHRVRDFEGDESAFEALINMAVQVASEGFTLRSVTIG